MRRDSNDSAEESVEESAAEPQGFGGVRVLVVDDVSSVREVLRRVLIADHHSVEVAENVYDAIAMVASSAFDVALVDKNLPDGSGLEVIEALKKTQADCGVVIMTADTDFESVVAAMRLGVSDFLEKPFRDIEIVRACITRVVEVAQLKRENHRLISDLQAKNRLIEGISIRDPLTRLFNHAFLHESVEREVQRSSRHGLEFALLLIDIDNFKKVNDVAGHAAGDALLRSFASLVDGSVCAVDSPFQLRSQDVVARFGGNEFAILLPETPKRGALSKAERLRKAVEHAELGDGDVMHQTVSIGVAAFPADASTRAELTAAADTALSAAKHFGRNRIVAYSQALPRFTSHGAHDLNHEIRRTEALESSMDAMAFDFVYQPIVRAQDSGVFGYEALCRPRDATFPHPGELIKAAEDAGKVRELGRIIRSLAIQGIQSIPENALLFINLHPDELHDPDLVEIEPFMEPWASRVVLEITEVASIKDTKRLKQTLAKLADAGFRVALDDLGSGYSGLNSLAMIEPDFVKLDMALVRRIDHEPRTRRLARHIVEFAVGEGMQVVAEGIETEEQRRALVDLGCPLLQGYFFGKGVPASQISKLH